MEELFEDTPEEIGFLEETAAKRKEYRAHIEGPHVPRQPDELPPRHLVAAQTRNPKTKVSDEVKVGPTRFRAHLSDAASSPARLPKKRASSSSACSMIRKAGQGNQGHYVEVVWWNGCDIGGAWPGSAG
jgi:hypothetical protein